MLLPTGTAVRFTNILGNTQKIQHDLTKLQQQISSGREANTFSELNVRVEVVHSLETKIRRTEKYMESNELIKSRLDSMDSALGGVVDAATEARNIITVARGAAKSQFPIFIQSMENLLNVAAEKLNVSIGGAYLFAGSQVDAPPVEVPVPEPLQEGIPDAGYYEGDGVVLKAKLSETLELNYGVNADEDAFQKLFAGMRLAIDGMNNDDDNQLAQAMDLINDAIDGTVAIQGRVVNNISIIDSANSRHEDSLPSAKEFLSAEVDTDVPAAVAKVYLAETLIQASFQVLSRVANLKLSDYL